MSTKDYNPDSPQNENHTDNTNQTNTISNQDMSQTFNQENLNNQEQTPDQNSYQNQNSYQDQNSYQNQNPYQNQNSYQNQEQFQQQTPYQGDPILANSKKKHSTLGIVGFILSFFGCLSFIGLIISIIDLASGKKEEKHTFAVAGIIVSIVMFILSIVVTVMVTYNVTKHHAAPSSDDTYWDSSDDSYADDTEYDDYYYDDDTESYYDDYADTEDGDDFNSTRLKLYNQAFANQALYPKDTPFENNDLELTFKDFGDYTATTDTPYDSDYKYYYVTATYNNYASYATYISSYNFSCIADGKNCMYAVELEDYSYNGDLDPDYTYDATIVFVVPKDAQKIDFIYTYLDDDFNEQAIIFQTNEN